MRLCCESAFKKDKRGGQDARWDSAERDGDSVNSLSERIRKHFARMEPRSGRNRKTSQRKTAAKEDGVTSPLTLQSFIQALLSSAVMSPSVALFSRRSARSSCLWTAAAHWLYSDL